MTRLRTPLLALTLAAYKDLGRALLALWPLGLVAGLINFASILADRIMLWLLSPPPNGREVIELIIGLASTALLAPFMVAVHRFILCDDLSERYWDARNKSRVAAITPWLLAFAYLPTVPVFLQRMVPGAASSAALIAAIVAFAILILSVRLIILVPAIAVDAPGATWRNALEDTRGQFWYLIGAVLIPLIPFLPINWVVASAGRDHETSAMVAIGWLAASLVTAVELALGTIVISRLYQILGDRLDQPLRSRN